MSTHSGENVITSFPVYKYTCMYVFQNYSLYGCYVTDSVCTVSTLSLVVVLIIVLYSQVYTFPDNNKLMMADW